MARSYDMTQRAAQARATAERVLDAAEHLLATSAVSAVTLQAIGDRAGVSVQTVLRHFGSRDGCLAAVGERLRDRVQQQRGGSSPDDPEAALTDLVDHYEAEGRLVLNLLAQERSDALAARWVEEGRSSHRDWVLRCFGARMATPDEIAVDAAVVATDIQVWRLLRLELGRDRRAVLRTMQRLLDGVLGEP